MTEDANAARGYTITRQLDAPRERVWEALTTPEHFAVWWGSDQTRIDDLSMDVREGGQWSATMVLPDGSTIPWAGEFLEVVAPERLVMTLADRESIGLEYETMTFVLEDNDTGTELVLRQHGGHLTDEQYEQGKQGTGGFLDTLAKVVAG